MKSTKVGTGQHLSPRLRCVLSRRRAVYVAVAKAFRMHIGMKNPHLKECRWPMHHWLLVWLWAWKDGQ